MQEKEVHPKSGHAQADPHASEFDEVVHVPKGQSKLRFFLLLGLTIVVLLIFMVPSELMQSFGGRGQSDESWVSWNDPVAGRIELSALELQQEQRALDDFYRVQGLGRVKGLSDPEPTAAMLLQDRLAQNAGIEVSDAELRKAILEGDPFAMPRGFFSAENYTARLGQLGVTPKSFETMLRRRLRVARYHQMLMTIAAVATPEDIEQVWKEGHQEYAFDYVELETASLDAALDAAAVDDAALDAWYLALPSRMSVFGDLQRPPRFSAEVVGYPIGGEFAADGLLAKYPRAADRDVEAEAQVYYQAVRDRRFRRAAPLEGTADGAAIDEATRLYLPYEEVAEAARREAPIYGAMRDWLADLSQRSAGGAAVDLAAEARELGVFYQSDEALRSNEEWSALGGVYGPFLTNALAGANPVTQLTEAVECEAGGFAFGRVKLRQPASLPPLAEVRERVLAEWRKSKRRELAVEKLAAVRATFPVPEAEAASDKDAPPKPRLPTADAATFAAAVAAAGLEVRRRDFAPRTPSKFAPQPPETPARKFFEATPALYSLAENEVAEPALDKSEEHAYLVRFEAKRDPSEVAITPGEYDSLKMVAELQAFRRYMERVSSPEYMAKTYGLRMRGSERAPTP